MEKIDPENLSKEKLLQLAQELEQKVEETQKSIEQLEKEKNEQIAAITGGEISEKEELPTKERELPTRERKERIQEPEKGEILPWGRKIREEEQNFIEKYQMKLNPETKEEIENFLQKITDEKRIDFVKKWFNENKDEIKEKGYNVKNQELGYMVGIASELGALDSNKMKKEYPEEYDEINNFYALRKDFEKENVPIESQFVVLNLLGKKTEAIKKELETAQKDNDKPTIDVKKIELEKLFKTRKELLEKACHRNLDNESEEKFGKPLLEKQEFLESLEQDPDKIDNIKIQIQERLELSDTDKSEISNYDELKEKLQEKHLQELKNLGYISKPTGLFRKKINIFDSTGKQVAKLGEKEIKDFLENKLKENIKNELWEKYQKDYKEKKMDFMEREINDIAESVERAEGGITSVCDRIRKRIIEEWKESLRKKQEKKQKTSEEIEEIGKGKGVDVMKLLQEASEKSKELSGFVNKDKEEISEFLKKFGIEVPPGEIVELDKKLREKEKKDKKKIGKGFPLWLIAIILLLVGTGKIAWEGTKLVLKTGESGGKTLGIGDKK